MKKNYSEACGRLTRDPELRNLGQSRVAKVGLCIPNSYKDKKTDEWKDDPVFIDLEAWNSLADQLMEFTKGQPICVQFALKQDTWETDGQKRVKILGRVQGLERDPYFDYKNKKWLKKGETASAAEKTEKVEEPAGDLESTIPF